MLQRYRRRICAIAFLIGAAALTGCNDSDETPDKVVVTEQPQELPTWLTPKDKMEPALWLRSREVGHLVLAIDPEVDRLRRALHQTQTRFYEDPRMIANRTDQTRQMLADVGQPEIDVDIITGLVDVADVSVGRKLYGEMCQHLINLSRNGEDRTTTMKQLAVAYRSKEKKS